MKSILLIAGLFMCLPFQAQTPLLLSEIAPTNTTQIDDEDHEYPDWIEIFNAGTSPQDLIGMSLSDNAKPGWILPDYTLNAGQRLLIFASGKNRGGVQHPGIDHWETAVNEGDLWRTFIGIEAPPADWAARTFNDDAWTEAPGGFGYGDGDDVTTVPPGTLSFYYRHTFSVTDIPELDSAILSMDFDDGFIAYLNGIEIARSFNMPPGVPDYTTLTTVDHEALMYGGGVPDIFSISKSDLNALLVPGENVLAIELHNIEQGSSDLTGRTWLHFGIASPDIFYGPNPPFFMGTVAGNGYYHTDFKIGFGETIRLFDAEGIQVDSIAVPYMQPGHSLMRIDDSGDWCYTGSPTPRAANGNTCFPGYADTPAITPAAGFYSAPQSVTISGNYLRYSTDGGDPDVNSPSYLDPISISQTTVVKARSFEPGKLPGKTATATYFMGETSHLPILSISAHSGDLFNDGSGGIAAYDDYDAGNSAPVHLEYFDKNRNLAFSENSSLRPVGGYSISFDQKSMQFDFDEEYGAMDDVHYPIFGNDKPGITSYRAFRVRNMDDDWNSTRIRDVIANRLALPTHCGATGYQHMAVFINGQYWGHYGGREVLNSYYVRDNHGADPDQVDQIFTSYFLQEKYFADEGTDVQFYAMSDFLLHHDMRDSSNFAAAQQIIDWENWVDYFAMEMYLANGDWFSSQYFNNLRIYRAPDLRWRYLMFDVTYAQNNSVSASTNILDEALAHPYYPNLYTDMMDSLLVNPWFKNYFINRFADLMNEYWTTAKALALIDNNIIEISSEIPRQSQRWGSLGTLDWINAVSYLKDFHRDRPPYQRQQIQDFFELNKQVEITLQVQPAEAGVIKISTIIPQHFPWTGIYFDGNPVTVTAIPNPGYAFDHWTSGFPPDSLDASFTINFTSDETFTAHFSGAPQPVALEVSEINFQSDSTLDAGDWYELINNGNYALDISGYTIQDKDWFHKYVTSTGTVIQPGEHMVVVEDDTKFTSRHPDVLYKTGGTGFGLDNQGEQIRLFDRSGSPVIDVTYDDKKPWPCTPGGFGRTLERISLSSNPNLPENWFEGCMEGSPGFPFSPCIDDVIVSEINYHSAQAKDAGDWFEIKNQLDIPVDLSGWSIRDENDLHHFVVPAGILIPEGGYYVFCEKDSAFSSQHPEVLNKLGDLGFGFDNSGDLIRLYGSDGLLRLSICYDDKAPWTTEADGNGFTLELNDPYVNVNDPFNWFAGCPGGSPGVQYDPECTTGVMAITSSVGMTLSPNPVDDRLSVQFSEPVSGEVRIVDIWGRILLSEPVTHHDLSLDLGRLVTGMYGVVLVYDRNMKVEKIMKR